MRYLNTNTDSSSRRRGGGKKNGRVGKLTTRELERRQAIEILLERRGRWSVRSFAQPGQMALCSSILLLAHHPTTSRRQLLVRLSPRPVCSAVFTSSWATGLLGSWVAASDAGAGGELQLAVYHTPG